jgi:rhamnopyranosyl-N-acetylglucosaminyl-diphospho-decaprenol beta-1,3/1,4-galactofuranosyltransferase
MSVTSQTALGVTVVFVTMNRCEIASICLDKLRAQTTRPGKIIVVNNASTDGTRAMLVEASDQSDGWIVVMDLEKNLGNAGGMQVAMAAAFEAGSQAVWILDDDSWPEPDALERLLNAEVPADCVISCRVVDLATGCLSWPLQTPVREGWQLIGPKDPLPAGDVIRIRRSWLGALISKKIYETVGPVEGRLFLRGEDEDYPRRIERAGFPVFMVMSSLLHHPPAGRLNLWEFAGRTVVLESGLIGDKLYYRLRNAWWMTRRDRGMSEAVVMALLHGFALLRWEPPMRKWLPVWWEALCDALQNRLGPRNDTSSHRELH